MSYWSKMQMRNATAAGIGRVVQHGIGCGISFVRARLSPEGKFGWRFTIGVLAFLGASWLFGGIAEDVITGDLLVQFDELISEWLRTHATSVLATGMRFASALASTTAVSLLALLIGGVFLWKRLWYSMLELVLVVAGGMLLNVLLKGIFGRPRPGWADPALVLSDPSFPSGHTMMATIILGYTAIYLVLEFASWRWRLLVAAMAILLALLVALSRMYLGAHYLSDVLAAMAAGTAWVALCVTAVETFRRHRVAARRVTPGPSRPASEQLESR